MHKNTTTNQSSPPQPDDDLENAFDNLDASDDGALDEADSLDIDDVGVGGANDPLKEVKYDKGLEADAKEEMSQLLKSFKDQARNEQSTFEDNTDSEFWCTLVFQNRDQKEAFLKAVGWFKHGDKYLDGKWVARKMGVTLPGAAPTFNTGEREKKFAALPAVDSVDKKV